MWTFKLAARHVSAALLVLSALTATGAGAEDDFDAFFRSFQEKRDGIGSLRAAFVQRTFLPEEVITTEGVIYYSRPRRVLFKTRDPETAILVDGRRGYEYDAEIRQLTVFEIEDHPRADIFFMGFDDDTDALREAYEVQLMITDDARGRQGLKIMPKPGTETEAYFIEVNLYLRDEDYLPYRIQIVNDEESQLFIDIEDLEKREEPDLDSARIFVPEGVAIIMDDRVAEHVGASGRYMPAAADAPDMEVRELDDAALTENNP